MKEPSPLDRDYYPRMKIANRWHLIVPETGYASPHDGCEFHTPNVGEFQCKLMNEHPGLDDPCPTHVRHDCGEYGTIFIRMAKWPEYRAHLVADKLEGKK